jgi:uroporphyrinogen decarboxylase
MATEAGIPSHLHACGKEAWLVELCATETDLSSIEPLEERPMGDCDLADIKCRWGRRIALKGNLRTTRVMAHGTLEDVERAAKKAIDAAACGGGFVLSTGDQCGRDTPDANIFRLVETARRYGTY